ncbi:response regulator [Planomicrobium sp. YIM 101495]|uniref:response regulator n=1 Tax=Planomicrobium sp. YIM 101495 TaxID=2665160 RepID=UPI0012B7DF47|nr:response regulator [Planomicrobium sp. YIM 101495]MTD31145.1 response regulator [Planomicrobium sp. YIM 101495]
MRAMIVDDEKLAVDYLGRLLTKLSDVSVIGTFTDPRQALKEAMVQKPDLLFLDIEMPGIKGVDLAEKLKQVLPSVSIIFVTAYPEFAVRAFALNAADYLVKPVRLERLQESLSRLKDKHPIAEATSFIKICTSHSISFLEVEAGKEKILQTKWRTSKVHSVFAYLLQHRDKPVRKDVLLEEFWRDMPPEKGYVQLYSAIYQIRKTCAGAGADIKIINRENNYQLLTNDAVVDVEEWEEELKELPVLANSSIAVHHRLVAGYPAHYLSDEDQLWADRERERLDLLWSHHAKKVADFLIKENLLVEAVSIFLLLQSYFPYLEENYLKLMELYGQLGDHHSVERQYTQLKKMLKEEYEMEPTLEIQSLYQAYRTSLEIKKK